MYFVKRNFIGLLVLFGVVLFATVGWFKPSTQIEEFNIPVKDLIDKAKKEELTEKSKKITRLNIDSSQIVMLMGVIQENAKIVANQISNIGKTGTPVYLLIDSPGGSVLDGAQIISAIEASKSPVYTVCMQLCASMAFIIHQYGKERYAFDRAILMAHPASGGVSGTLEQMESRLGTISKYVDKMDIYIAKKMDITLEKYKQLTVSEMWLDSEDSLKAKLLDKIVYINSDLKFMPSLSTDSNKLNKDKIDVRWF